MKIIMRRPGSDDQLVLDEDFRYSYQALGWQYEGPAPEEQPQPEPPKPKKSKHK